MELYYIFYNDKLLRENKIFLKIDE